MLRLLVKMLKIFKKIKKLMLNKKQMKMLRINTV